MECGSGPPCPATAAEPASGGMRLPARSWHEAELTPPLPDDVRTSACGAWLRAHVWPFALCVRFRRVRVKGLGRMVHALPHFLFTRTFFFIAVL